MKVLIVSPDYPYPANHGGRLDVFKRIAEMEARGWDVYLLSTLNQSDYEEISSSNPKHFFSFRDVSLLNLLSIRPFQQASRRLTSIPLELLSMEFDLAFFEGDYVSHFSTVLNYKKGILRVQNDEAKYFFELGKSAGIITSLYYFVESLKFYCAGKIDKFKFDEYWYISEKEFSRSRISSKSFFVPPHYRLTEKKIEVSKDKKGVLFIGSLFMINNLRGLKWYLKSVHPKLLKNESYKLTVAGNSRGSDISWISSHERVEVFDTPDDLEPLYKDACVFINPMLHGAGLKLKTIDAITHNLPVVSTSTGSEGTGLVDGAHILIKDLEQDFADSIETLLMDYQYRSTIMQNGYDFVRCNYDMSSHLSRVEVKI
jgi:hypothetical protein